MTSNVVKVMFIAYFSFMCATTIMVISVCVNLFDNVLQLLVIGFGSSCDFLITTCYWWLLVYYKATKHI